jgi:hypothetical protein
MERREEVAQGKENFRNVLAEQGYLQFQCLLLCDRTGGCWVWGEELLAQ